MPRSQDAQSVLPGPADSMFPENLLEMQILGPTPDLLNQKLWTWSTVICPKKPFFRGFRRPLNV